ncbi:ImmA/IrrE family metallo-endopeptidase [Sphingobium lignivorans]|uniref:Zn-dependent peptidase ImmA (M78 family)/transcriptional regulator with XRE-family HTH domain n=1 Tax=Sphingobium lignivorans TaxID=2735886 RepID=A0ABR6NH63_9SPHN|nr:Zn-dependent peptidase ImmA (M78 family)/transcriptional regulator with XRE-family HTH domain [Sphingobium lignivorans]
MAEINPEILIWARKTAGLDLETAARKIALNAARGMSGAERLAAIEAGEVMPSAALLRRMAEKYHRPILTFYLPTVPAPPQLGQDFRTLPDQGDESNILLATLLRDVKARQALVRETLEEDEDAVEVDLVGSAKGIRNAAELGAAIARAIDFDRAAYRAHAKGEEAFAYLRTLVEGKGVFVLLAGDCGHWSTAIEVGIFRGFAIADRLAPFIVINDQDAKSAWAFTLLHELAHLLIGETGVSGGTPAAGIEQLCNDAAAAVLVDRAEVVDLKRLLRDGDGDINVIEVFADKARISQSMVAYQLFRVGVIDEVRWTELRDTFRRLWVTQKDRERERNRGKDGGPNWYVVRRHRLGSAILAVARQGMADGSLTPTRAARMLGVKPMNVYPLLAEPRRANA